MTVLPIASAWLVTLAAAGEPRLATSLGPVEVRLAAQDTRSAEAAWTKFVDRLFQHCDRDGDGLLQRAEAAAMIALPLGERATLRLDFARADNNHDGVLDLREWRDYLRRGGFTPVVVRLKPADPTAARLHDALLRQLDRDGDGQLTRAELGGAGRLLQTLDEDEDEALTAAEVLAASARETPPATVGRDAQPIVAHVAWSGQPAPALVERPSAGAWTVGPATDDPARAFARTRQFLLAQFKSALGADNFLTRAAAMDDPALQVIGELFDAADRDGDGKLTTVELERLLDLIGAGVVCQISVTVDDRGPNLFAALDADGDGRLSLRELNAAPRLLGARDRLSAAELPHRIGLTVGRGVTAARFGPAPLARLVNQPGSTTVPASAAGSLPRWFRAADRNGDGLLSPREFPGSRELFRKLDRDGDGVLSPEEGRQ